MEIRYLPYRQLRNAQKTGRKRRPCYLPYRQLRNLKIRLFYVPIRYLPYRQFRKYEKYVDESKKGYLPYRQVIYFIVLFLWLTSDGGRLFVLRG